MNNIYRYILIVFCGLALYGCMQVEEPYAEEFVSMTFTARTEGDTDTKTTLDGEIGEKTHRVLWNPEDEILILPVVQQENLTGYAFNNTSTEISQTAVFEGLACNADKYHAFYPRYNIISANQDKIEFCLSSEYTYTNGTFPEFSFPMAATVTAGEDISFNNLCGILALRLTGKEVVRSVTFMTNNNQKVAGTFSVNMTDGEWQMIPTQEGTTFITMDCGEEGVQLKETEATVFYFSLPPQVYESFDIQIITTDGSMMFKHAGNPLEVKRSVLTPSGALSYVESFDIDLSERGTANCYMIHNAGMYSFDASVIGIGNDGIIPDAGYHTSDASITPSDAMTIWSEPSDIINNLSYDSETKRISFYTNGAEGNAVIAATDDAGTILWSWHIWVTDRPIEQYYKNDNGEFYVLDRNLGATRADKGNGVEWKEAIGTYYQWGRKDPFLNGLYTTQSGKLEIAVSISQPALLSTGNPWMTPTNHTLWDSSQKTIYDPCPTGYVVNSDAVWNSFTGKTISNQDNGWSLTTDGINKTWIPSAGWIDISGKIQSKNNEAYMWSGKHDKNLHLVDNRIETGSWDLNNGFTVRCMKDDNYIDPLYPSLKLKEIVDITSSSASVISTITYNGKGDINRRGVVCGSSPTVTIDNGIMFESTDNTSEFTTYVSSLEMATGYYVRAYAVNDVGVAYSTAVRFHTIYEGNGTDLSKNGTSNSYIVPPVYSAYTFDCTVKGNSNVSVGTPVSAEVIWETKNTTDVVSHGEIIPSVSLEDGKVRFMLPFEPVHGNALIAVKDAGGKILWSWHIWVTDYDPETDSDIYASGAKMMDRNLGALSCEPGDIRSHGFFYQWGRKDPLLSAVNSNSFISAYPTESAKRYVTANDSNRTFEYTVEHPTDIVMGAFWMQSAEWWHSNKTTYDPCPYGWRVPDGIPGVWEGTAHVNATGGYYLNPPYSTPAAYYPGTGYMHGTDQTIYWFGSAVYSMSCSSYTDADMSLLCMFSSTHDESMQVGKGGEFTVRCMKDADIVPETISVTDITDESARLKGRLTINDNTVIEEMGFVLGTSNSNISITNESCTKFTVTYTEGDYYVDATGITPNTTYYVRAYAKGGYNTKYGEVMEFRTHSIGINDDFTDDEYEWE